MPNSPIRRQVLAAGLIESLLLAARRSLNNLEVPLA
jgi:hypothetical protein